MQPNGNEPAQAYDVVIAGTGIAGVAAAVAAAEAKFLFLGRGRTRDTFVPD
jgi:thioredoxin reductase